MKNSSNFLPILPPTIVGINSILKAYVEVENILEIVFSDPSFLIDLYIYDTTNTNDIMKIVSSIGINALTNFVKQLPIYPLSLQNEYKNIFNIEKKLKELKKNILIFNLIFNNDKDINLIKSVYLIKEWKEFFALYYNSSLLINKRYEEINSKYMKFLQQNLGDKVIYKELNNPEIVKKIDEIKFLLKNPEKIKEHPKKDEILSLLKKEITIYDINFLNKYIFYLEENNDVLKSEISKVNLKLKENTEILKFYKLIIDVIKDVVDIEHIANLKNVYNIILNKINDYFSVFLLNKENLISSKGQRKLSKEELYEIKTTHNDVNISSTKYLSKIEFLPQDFYLYKITLNKDYILILSKKEKLSTKELQILKEFENILQLIGSLSDMFNKKLTQLKESEEKNIIGQTQELLNSYYHILKKYSNIDYYKFEDVKKIIDILNKEFIKLMDKFKTKVLKTGEN